MIRLSSLVQRQKILSAVLLTTALFYSGFLLAAPVKVAFTGDQGAGEGARAVLSLIASEGADLLLIQGDLGYGDGLASTWEENMTQALGADFPVLAVVGNHENYEWPLYKRFIQRRIDRADGLSCSGDTGVKALCRYENIEIVQVSPGIDEVEGVNGQDDYSDFIASSFDESTAPWRICAWHKNQSKMQTGKKSDATGWNVYDACLDAGAMIALAHEHAYSRSYLLSDFRSQDVAHKNSEMTLEPGRSFAVVSGLGGHEVREQIQGGDWWASIYTASQGATHGALFCTFEETTAECYFKAIDGAVPDQFTLKTRLGSVSESVAAAPILAEAAPAVVEPEVVDASVVEEPAVETDVYSVSQVEQDPDESADTGPLSVITDETVVPDNSVSSPVYSQTDRSTTQADSGGSTSSVVGVSSASSDVGASSASSVVGASSASSDVGGGSAGSDVGAGSISLFLILIMLIRTRLSGFLRRQDDLIRDSRCSSKELCS